MPRKIANDTVESDRCQAAAQIEGPKDQPLAPDSHPSGAATGQLGAFDGILSFGIDLIFG